MHAVLDLKTDGAVAKHYETLEKGLGEASASCFLVHDHGPELLGGKKM